VKRAGIKGGDEMGRGEGGGEPRKDGVLLSPRCAPAGKMVRPPLLFSTRRNHFLGGEGACLRRGMESSQSSMIALPARGSRQGKCFLSFFIECYLAAPREDAWDEGTAADRGPNREGEGSAIRSDSRLRAGEGGEKKKLYSMLNKRKGGFKEAALSSPYHSKKEEEKPRRLLSYLMRRKGGVTHRPAEGEEERLFTAATDERGKWEWKRRLLRRFFASSVGDEFRGRKSEGRKKSIFSLKLRREKKSDSGAPLSFARCLRKKRERASCSSPCTRERGRGEMSSEDGGCRTLPSALVFLEKRGMLHWVSPNSPCLAEEGNKMGDLLYSGLSQHPAKGEGKVGSPL